MRMKASNPSSTTWHDLTGHFDLLVLCAPRTGGDPHGGWSPVNERIVRFLLRHVAGKPWADHLVLAAAVLSARRCDVSTVEETVHKLHARFSTLFAAFALETMEAWKVDVHLPAYLQGEVAPSDSQHMRYSFLTFYAGTAKHVWNWFDALPAPAQQLYRRFVLPVVNPLLIEALSKGKELMLQQQREHRKAETEAVVPHFAALRAEAHFRYNRVLRLRQAYQQALGHVFPDHSNLPLDFSYEEGDPPVERFHFKLWDRRTFVLDPEHIKHYSKYTIFQARKRTFAFQDERNCVFVVFVRAERLDGDAPPEGFWFTELLSLNLLGAKPCVGKEHEVEDRQARLRQWGYGDDSLHRLVAPFVTKIPGLLSWTDEGNQEGASLSNFISDAQQRTKGTLVPIESLYAAATFGLLALDLLTTTGIQVTWNMPPSSLTFTPSTAFFGPFAQQ